MKGLSVPICALMWALSLAGAASAQPVPPNGSLYNPPPPPPPPGPNIEVPAIPKMDAPPSQPNIRSAPRGSFGDRISKCLDEGTAAGLDPAQRSAYSRSCANR